MFLGLDGNVVNNSNHMGALSVGVPGTVAGLWKAHQERGSLPWEQLVAPAIKLASEGIPIRIRCKAVSCAISHASIYTLSQQKFFKAMALRMN
jgi:gamma-glutamyltranspeptidase